ncbi:type I restriction-modification system subunit M [Acidaminobacter hydrogenoformans]|uniref:site-specific DNA-methyltransferase (adenine-specific) n=1 Tax=Acidaminobacter hydrogenoformans DSM 2784 TaxID=1120920 RepID=A0A1G5S252_9FIRM|nr:type I restriction-modification system subunit M [Acidaminobacter hydrogenoformans]SCZ80475.1 type I restriction enzyme M protein [Acidaminobacter hydrogenoformans DSM 2784]
MNKQKLANRIWESANKMRSKIEANEYKDYILGFIFYKYLSDKEVRFMKSKGATAEDIKLLSEEDTETVKYIQGNIGYFIAHKDLFSTWLTLGKDFDISNVRDALSAFSRLIDSNYKKVFDGIFETLQTGLTKLGESSGSQTKAASDLIQLIKDIPMDGKQDYDVLGFIYEYLISNFAANAGKKAGEFYTPHEVSLLMSEIVADHLKDRKEIQIYDPTSGSGSLLINIGRSVSKHIDDDDNIKYYAQELKQNTYNLTRMNLVMRGILPSNITTRNGDTLEDDWPYFDESDPIGTYNPLYVDAVVSNPPYSQHWDPENKETDPRYARFGLAPKGKADYAFLLHDLYHIKPNGIMTIVLPHGVLFRGGEEGVIRKNLIENNHIDVIIGLPANIFFGTGIPTIIMVLKQKRENTDVHIIDASKGFTKVGKNNKLRASDIKRIADTVAARKDLPKFARVISRDEIRSNEYNLNIPRYVDSSDSPESWDIYSSMFGGIPKREIEELSAYWLAFPGLKAELFTNDSGEHVNIKERCLKDIIKNHPDVISFKEHFAGAFSGFDAEIYSHLVEGMETLNISKEETLLSNEIFERLSSVPLVDEYRAYQILNDAWVKISVDLEIIQTEGFSAIKKVDPNMVIKKKNGVDVEVQEGWLGRIIPFDLVQEALLHEEAAALKEKEDRLAQVTVELKEILDSLTEEEKEDISDVLNEDNTEFVTGLVVKAAKDLLKGHQASDYAVDSPEGKILAVMNLLDDEKGLKKNIKSDSDKLHSLTKETIENLTDEQVYSLLELKWIKPLMKELHQISLVILDTLASKVQAISDKYAITFSDVEDEIVKTESALSSMLEQLTGSEVDMRGLSELKALLGGE